jgi:glutathione peroxidase
MQSIYPINIETLDGQAQTLEPYRGKVLLIVNTASRCGFTPQYQGLEMLYQTYKDRGFTILGFPCNQFGGQEPGDSSAIADFCELNYAISFPMFAKIEVNGLHTHPLYQYLKKAAPGFLGSKAIKWNFTKFLLDRNGAVYKRNGSLIPPERLKADIEKLL